MYTYYHREQERYIVVISEEKVPEKNDYTVSDFKSKAALALRLSEKYFSEIESWLSRSKAYDVFSGEEEKFKNYILGQNYPSSYYILLPNEVVRINLVYIFNEGSYYNFCSVCKGQFMGAKRQPVCKTCCDKEYAFFNQPEEKDLWPKAEDMEKYFPEFKEHPELTEYIMSKRTGAYEIIEVLKQKYNLIPKSRDEKPSI